VRESIEIKQQPNAAPRLGTSAPVLLLTSLSVVTGFTALNGGLVLAQTTLEIPATPTSTPTALTAPQPAVVSSPTPAPVAPPENISPEFATPASPAPVPLTPALANPSSVPATQADIPLPSPSEGYEPPSAVIFSERSSGCEVTLGQGQDLTGLCGRPPVLSSPLAPAANLPATPGEVPAMAAEPAAESIAPRGPFGFSSAGISVNLPAIKPYFNRGPRPLGRPGNGNVSLLFPLAIPAPITSLFGWRTHPITGDSRFHSGTDLGAPMGTPVLAALAGQVALADFFGGYGLSVALNHSKGTQQTLYAHLSEIFVKPGEWVKQGTVIGRVGSTGASTGPHLHFEFRQLTADGWIAQDPGWALEQALAQLTQSMQVAQVPNQAPGKTPLKSGQPLPPIGKAPIKGPIAVNPRAPQSKQILELARQLALAAQANQPLQPTFYNTQKLPIGRLASVPIAE
jgi:murein DD-endopeptidase MepM/ murein hydrolase activator NlpD